MLSTILSLTTALFSNPSVAEAAQSASRDLVDSVLIPSASRTLGKISTEPQEGSDSQQRQQQEEHTSPFLLDFSLGWNQDSPVRKWYQRECTLGSTAVTKLEFRRDRQGLWLHGFVVVFTESGRIYRIDRRPDLTLVQQAGNAGGNPDSLSSLLSEGCTALDEIYCLNEGQEEYDREIVANSDCVVQLVFHHPVVRGNNPHSSTSLSPPSTSNRCHSVYLLHILSVCFAVRDDETTRLYTLQRWNCYYMAWIIIMISYRWVSDWDTRTLLALSSSQGSHQDVDSDSEELSTISTSTNLSKGKFLHRCDWQTSILTGWRAFYQPILAHQQVVPSEDGPSAASRRRRTRTLIQMLDHVLQRVLETEPITYPTLFLHPNNVLHQLGKSIAENMPESFNAAVSRLARGGSDSTDEDATSTEDLGALVHQAKLHLRQLFTEQRLLDPVGLMLLPSEFRSWLQNTPPRPVSATAGSAPQKSSPYNSMASSPALRIASVRHALYRDAMERTTTPSGSSATEAAPSPFAYGEMYSDIASHCFDLPVIEQEAEIYIFKSEPQLSGPIELETFMRDLVKSHANTVTRWWLVRREEHVDQDIIDAMHRVWDKVMIKFPKALAERWL